MAKPASKPDRPAPAPADQVTVNLVRSLVERTVLLSTETIAMREELNQLRQRVAEACDLLRQLTERFAAGDIQRSEHGEEGLELTRLDSQLAAELDNTRRLLDLDDDDDDQEGAPQAEAPQQPSTPPARPPLRPQGPSAASGQGRPPIKPHRPT